MRIAAVVVTFNRKEMLNKCLRALLDQTKPLDEIIVIDNASTDGTEEFVRTAFPEINYVNIPENIGGAGGFSKGMKLAYDREYNWIWVMDDDAIPMPDALAALLRFDKLSDDVFVLASAVLFPDGSIDAFHRRLFDPVTLLERPVDVVHYQDSCFEVDTSSFVGMLIKRPTITEVGLPLKEFFIYYDDTEFSLRIKQHGGRILTVPGSRIKHGCGGRAASRGLRKNSFTWRNYYGKRNMIYVYRKYGKPGIRFYHKLVVRAIKDQLGIILFRRCKLNSTKIIWLAFFDGLRGKLGKKIDPSPG